MSNSGRTVMQALVGLLVLALVAGIIAVVYKYTDGFNEDFKTFYVEHDGKQILTENTTMTFEADIKQSFIVKYTFDGKDETPRDYSVKVITNTATDFEYSVEDKRCLYSKASELTEAFGIEKGKTSFTMSLTKGMNIQNVLRKSHSSNDVIVPKAAEEIEFPYVLVISSYNDKVKFNIKFGITGTDGVEYPTPDPDGHGMTLDKTSIVF